jgi:hypothetical protein
MDGKKDNVNLYINIVIFVFVVLIGIVLYFVLKSAKLSAVHPTYDCVQNMAYGYSLPEKIYHTLADRPVDTSMNYVSKETVADPVDISWRANTTKDSIWAKSYF